jgi:hypothetical protein
MLVSGTPVFHHLCRIRQIAHHAHFRSAGLALVRPCLLPESPPQRASAGHFPLEV